MVAFEQYRAARLQVVEDMVSGVPEVGENADFGGATAACQLKWLARVVRHGKWRNGHCADLNRLAVACNSQHASKIGCADRCIRAGAHPHRKLVAQGQRCCAANVVAVLMGDKNGVDLVGLQTCCLQPRQEVLEPKTAVNQQPYRVFVASFNDCRISCTAAAEAPESQHRKLPTRSAARRALRTP